MRLSALNRSSISEEIRNKISKKIGKIYLISRVDNSTFLSPEEVMVSFLKLHTAKAVRIFLDCSEKQYYEL